jgi:hypothetical protein
VNASLLADENTSHRLVAACRQIEADFPIVHIADWESGAYLSVKDPALLMALRESKMILVSFDRASIPMHAGELTREGLGHGGVILFRRSVSAIAYGKQARLLVDFWQETPNVDWTDRIEYLPHDSLSFAVSEPHAGYFASEYGLTSAQSAKAGAVPRRTMTRARRAGKLRKITKQTDFTSKKPRRSRLKN